MENKWLLLSVISDSDLGRSYDTIRIKSKYIALWYIFDKYLPLIILTKLILTLYVTSWLLLQSNRCHLHQSLYLYLYLSLYLYIYLLTHIHIHIVHVEPLLSIPNTHTYIVYIYISCLCIRNVQNWFSHTIKNEEESQRISFALQLKIPSQNYRSYSVESVSNVSYTYIRTYINIWHTHTYVAVSVIHLLCHHETQNEIENHNKELHPQLTIKHLPYIQHHTDLYMQFIMRKLGNYWNYLNAT